VRASTPTKAKQLGQSVVIRRDWEAIKLQVMRDAIRFKFPTIHHELSELLLATGDAMLIEGNAWDDRYWGAIYNLETDKWTGYNWLGHLLMARRAELRSRVE
jgi:N-glycosidase YbiA